MFCAEVKTRKEKISILVHYFLIYKYIYLGVNKDKDFFSFLLYALSSPLLCIFIPSSLPSKQCFTINGEFSKVITHIKHWFVFIEY